MKKTNIAPFTKSYNMTEFEISLMDNLIYSILYGYMNKRTKRCNVSIDKLVTVTGIARQTIIESIKQLSKEKLIIVEQTKKGNKTNNNYKFPEWDKFNQIPKDFISNPAYKAKLKAFIISFRGLFISSDLVCKYNKTEISGMLGIDIRTLNKYIKEMTEYNMLSFNNYNKAYYLNADVINWRLTQLENDVKDIKENKADKKDLDTLKEVIAKQQAQIDQLIKMQTKNIA